MAEISASLVKGLREKTGAGMMDCKRALAETAGEMEAAIDWLRKKGLAAAAKRADRVASEGLIGVHVEGGRGVLVEVNCETDFVARGEPFRAFARTVSRLALAAEGDLDKLNAMAFPGTGRTVADELTQMIATIGENMALRRTATLSVGSGVLAPYIHSAQAEGLGRIGVLVAVETAATGAEIEQLGKKVAMHVAAANPTSLAREQVDPELLRREKDILSEQARASGKPEAIIEKMVQGRLAKFYEEVCLLEQTYVVDGESKVAKVIDQAAQQAGQPIAVTGFLRFALGEGLAKKQAETASAAAS